MKIIWTQTLKNFLFLIFNALNEMPFSRWIPTSLKILYEYRSESTFNCRFCHSCIKLTHTQEVIWKARLKYWLKVRNDQLCMFVCVIHFRIRIKIKILEIFTWQQYKKWCKRKWKICHGVKHISQPFAGISVQHKQINSDSYRNLNILRNS